MQLEIRVKEYLSDEQKLLRELSRQLRAEAERIAANCQVSEEFAFVDPGFLNLFQRFWQEHFSPYTLPLLQSLADSAKDSQALLSQVVVELLTIEPELAAAWQRYCRGQEGAAWDLSRTLTALADLTAEAARLVAAKLKPTNSESELALAFEELQYSIPPGPAMAAAQQLVQQLGQKRCWHD